MQDRLRNVIILVTAFLLLACITKYGYEDAQQKSRPYVLVPSTNRSKFCDVIVLLDLTRTMNRWDVNKAKEIVEKQIVKAQGVNDRLACYTLSGRFDDVQSCVFGAYEEQPPQLQDSDAQKLLSLYRTGGGKVYIEDADQAEETGQIITGLKAKQQKAEAVQGQWLSKINLLQRPAIDGSDYLGALEGIKRRWKNAGPESSPNPSSAREKWLFIVGDLIDESPANRPKELDNTALKSVNHIVLVYPFDSSRDESKIESFWRKYFGDIKFAQYTFAKAISEEFLTAPNPALGLEIGHPPSFWECFRPYVIADAVIIFLLLVYFFFRGRSSFFKYLKLLRKHAAARGR
ncbi:MAG: hypothetical protein ACJ74J_05845 [Blastocatellia bacterium]